MKQSGPLDRAFRILDIVASARYELSLVEIVNASGLPQSSTFRLASNLVDYGLLRFDKNVKTYSLGPRAKRLAFFVMGQNDLKAVVTPVLEQLTARFHETAYFVRRDIRGAKLVTYVILEEGARSFIHPGVEFPAHATAAGKVIHSFESPADHVFDIHGELVKFQDKTELAPERLEKIFAQVRQQGYAVSDSEIDRRTFAVAAPVFLQDEVIGAVGVVGPDDRMKPMMPVAEAGEILKSAAAEITYFLNAPHMKNGSDNTVSR